MRVAALPISFLEVILMSIALERQTLPKRTVRYQDEPGFYEPGGLWLYGNVRLLDSRLAYIPTAFGSAIHLPADLDAIERQAETIVLTGQVLVCGIHSPAHQRSAVVPLRWGSPRIVVVSGGFRRHLGNELGSEPFRAGRLWRYEWDPATDLIVSRRAPHKLPTFGHHNPTVDRLVAFIGLRNERAPLSRLQQLVDPLALKVWE